MIENNDNNNDDSDEAVALGEVLEVKTNNDDFKDLKGKSYQYTPVLQTKVVGGGRGLGGRGVHLSLRELDDVIQ